jgi:hypothetical protein
MKIETAKVQIKVGDEVLVKRINLKGKILDYFKTTEEAVIEIELENGVTSYFFLNDIDKIITESENK